MVKFIDISEHNNMLSFDAIKDSNLEGVIMKATEGTTYIDHIMDIFYEALKGKNNIGFYHYLTSTSSPITQAQNFWNKIKDKQYQIFPVLDVEQDSLGSNAELYSIQFIEEFHRLSGQKMLIYSGRCYIEEHFSDDFKKNNNWWVADYSANDVPKISGCNIIAWQYTDTASYTFAIGDVDTSILVNEECFYINKQPIYKEKETIQGISFLQTELNNQGCKDKNGNKLIVDGVAGELTLSACPTIKKGAQGNITKWIQEQLKISDDSIFGEQTRQAMIIYQENKSLVGDGVVGQKTWTKLLGL